MKISEIEAAHTQNKVKMFYRKIKAHNTSFQPRLNICMNINRNTLTEGKEILE